MIQFSLNQRSPPQWSQMFFPTIAHLSVSFFFFFNIYLVAPGLIYLFIFIFIFGCVGSSFLCEGFL